MAEKPAITAKIGTPPPAHAPRETSQPLTTEAMAAQLAKARAHEKDLPTFAPPPDQQVALPPGVKPGDPDAVAQFRAWIDAKRPTNWDAAAFRAGVVAPVADVPRGTPAAPVDPVSAAGSARPDPTELEGSDAIAAVSAAFAAMTEGKTAVTEGKTADPPPLERRQPAASDTESPSRGIPSPISDPGKQIKGGFGVAAAAAGLEYIPLDGRELGTLLQAFLVEIAERLTNDLRFSIAVTYPRVRARVELIVESYMSETDFRIVRHFPEINRAPLEIAREHADEICFVIANERREVAADGSVSAPANAIRAELGVEIPHKQVIETPAGRLVVDRQS